MYIPRVLESVVASHASTRFVIAGGGPEEHDLRLAVERSHVRDRVEVFGAVPHDQIRSLYWAADVFMMPSYTEGFPRVLLEAMAMGVPIASTDVGGVREVLPVEYQGRLADPDQPQELADAVHELISDPALSRQLIVSGNRWVRRFDARAVAKQLVALSSK
jgi:glycosyltransferase involved in cell wall biosynthesis